MKKTLLHCVFMATVALTLFVSCQKQELVESKDDSKNELSMVDQAKEFILGQYGQTKSDGPSILPPSPYSDIAWERAIVVSDEWGEAVNIPLENNATLDVSFYNRYTNKFVKRTDTRQDLVYIRKRDASGNEVEESYLVVKIYLNPIFISSNLITNANFELVTDIGFQNPQSKPFSGLVIWHRMDGSLYKVSEYSKGSRTKTVDHGEPKEITGPLLEMYYTQPDIMIMRATGSEPNKDVPKCVQADEIYCYGSKPIELVQFKHIAIFREVLLTDGSGGFGSLNEGCGYGSPIPDLNYTMTKSELQTMFNKLIQLISKGLPLNTNTLFPFLKGYVSAHSYAPIEITYNGQTIIISTVEVHLDYGDGSLRHGPKDWPSTINGRTRFGFYGGNGSTDYCPFEFQVEDKYVDTVREWLK